VYVILWYVLQQHAANMHGRRWVSFLCSGRHNGQGRLPVSPSLFCLLTVITGAPSLQLGTSTLHPLLAQMLMEGKVRAGARYRY